MLAPQWRCTSHRGCLGAIAKLGPGASSETWALVRWTPDRFFTHLSNCIVVAVVFVSAVVVPIADAVIHAKVHVWLFFEQPPELFEQPPLVGWHNQLKFLRCLSKVVWYLHSLTLFMKSLHSLNKVLLSWPLSSFIHGFLKHVHAFMVLIIDLTQSSTSCFSALCKIFLPWGLWCYSSI